MFKDDQNHGARRRIMLAGAVLMATAAGPAPAQSDLPTIVKEGQNVFETVGGVGCAACHGPYAEGDVGIGPYTRGVTEEKIRQAMDGIAQMAFLQGEMEEQEVRQVAAYMEYLGELKLVKVLVKLGRFIPDSIDVHPGDEIQLVLNNAASSAHEFDLTSIGLGKRVAEPRKDIALIWTAPVEEGAFKLSCTDCRIPGSLTVNVTTGAEPFGDVKVAAAAPAPEATAPVPAEQRDPQLIAMGEEVFHNAGGVGCVACHGPYAEGNVGIGPYNRGFSEGRIRAALKKVPEMAFLTDALSNEEIEAVSAYYARLGELKLVKTRLIRAKFYPQEIRVAPGTKIQLVVTNTNHRVHTMASPDMGVENFAIPGTEDEDIVWVAPQEAGEYELACADCSEGGAPLHIVIE